MYIYAFVCGQMLVCLHFAFVQVVINEDQARTQKASLINGEVIKTLDEVWKYLPDTPEGNIHTSLHGSAGDSCIN